MFERASVLFNLASLFSQLALSEDRSSIEGIKRAVAYYQVSLSTISINPEPTKMTPSKRQVPCRICEPQSYLESLCQ